MEEQGDLVLIAAVAENRVIGLNGEMPWNIRGDLKRFREMTLKHAVIMGRKTAEELERKRAFPLDQRLNLVISSLDYNNIWENVIGTRNLDFAIERGKRYNVDGLVY